MAEPNPTVASLLGFLRRRFALATVHFGMEYEEAGLRWFAARPWTEEPSADP